MSQIMIQIEHEIKEIVLKAVGQAVAEQELPAEPMPSFQIAIPNDRAHGDYAINAAMVSAKAFRLPPRKIAECIASRLDFTGTYLSRAEIAGPGFINFFLDDRLYGEILKDIEDKKEKYGASDYGKGETYMVEFVSANPTGAFLRRLHSDKGVLYQRCRQPDRKIRFFPERPLFADL